MPAARWAAWVSTFAADNLSDLRRLFTCNSHAKVGDGGALGSALEHCMYAGGALGRVGLDFRAALPPLFESCILGLFTQARTFATLQASSYDFDDSNCTTFGAQSADFLRLLNRCERSSRRALPPVV